MDEPEPRVEPETFAIRLLQTAMAGAEASLAQRLALNPTDLAALAQITWAHAAVGPGDLAHFLNISPGGVTEVIDRLTSAGYVERHRDLADRRRVRLQPSETAAGVMHGHIAPLITALDDIAREGSDSDRRVILLFLEQVAGAYSAWAAGTQTPDDLGQ